MIGSNGRFAVYLAVDGHRSIEDAVHAENGRLWQVDDGRAEEGAEDAAVADGERAALHVLDGELVEASLLAKREYLALNVRIAHALHIAHHWHY